MTKVFQHGRMLTAVLLAVVLFAASCKKDKSEEQPIPAQKLEKFAIGDEFLSFTYNADGTVKQAVVKEDAVSGGATVTYNITYDAQKKMSLVVNSDGEKLTPIYVNNKMTKVEVHDQDDDLVGVTEYTYQGNQLTSATVRAALFGPMADLMKFEFAYNAAGNITRTSYFNVNPATGAMELSDYVNYEYDNKTNPLSALSEFLKLVWFVPSPNNIVKELHKDANDVLEETVIYNFTYNAQQLPSTGTLKRTVTGQPEENEAIQVIYK